MTEDLPQGFDEFEFSDSTLGGGDSAPEAFGSSLQDEFGARRLLDPLLVDPAEMNRLRRAYSANHPYADLSGISDVELIDTLTSRPAQRAWGLDFLVRTSRTPIFSGSGEQRAEEATSVGTSEPTTVAATKPWIKFRVVWDADGAPIPNVAFMVEAPDGSSEEQTTNAEGIVDIEEAESGDYAVSCDRKKWRLSQTLDFVKAQASPVTTASQPSAQKDGGGETGPWRILEVLEHKVRSGESIKSIAEANGMTWQQLSIFNWDTAVPDEINEHLRDDVGCRKKTADGHNYVFDDADDPGIIHIPKPWSRSGLRAEKVHVIRVRTIRLPSGEFIFSY